MTRIGRGPDRRVADAGRKVEQRHNGERRHRGIGSLPLFLSVDEAQLDEVLGDCDVLTLPAGAPVMRPGDINPYIYVLLSGHVDVYLDEHQHEATATPIEPGEVFGLISGIEGKSTSALVVPQTDVRVIRVTWDVFRNSLMTLPGVAPRLMANMVERIRRGNAQALAALREHLEFEHLQRELELARRLQSNMLPQQRPMFPDRREIAVCGLMEPAAKVGGDLFDAFFVDDRHLFFCVGDAAGHGVTAAMVMARTIGLLHLLAMNRLPPDELLGALNDRLAAGNDTGIFVTLLCGLLDVESGRLTYANGGHCAPIVIRGGRAETLPLPKGSVVGALPGQRFPALESRLDPGDTLLCYTDGLIEARNPAGEQFSVQRCLDIANRDNADGPSALLDAIYMDLYKFTQTDALEDDFTVLGIRRRATAAD